MIQFLIIIIIDFISHAWFKVVSHLEDDAIGGLEASVTRMLEADPNFRKLYSVAIKFSYC